MWCGRRPASRHTHCVGGALVDDGVCGLPQVSFRPFSGEDERRKQFFLDSRVHRFVLPVRTTRLSYLGTEKLVLDNS